MSHTELISVIVPVYNIASYIENCVRSIMRQSHSTIQIVAVDDGSSDGSGEILDQLAREYAAIKVIHQANGGVTNARLSGVKAAAGNWIGFVDGDDLIEPDMYERLLNNAHKYSADISHCGYQMVFPSRVDYYYGTGRRVIQDNKNGLKDLIEGRFVEPGLCNKLYHKKLFQRLINDNLMDTSIKNTEDLLMNFYLFRESKRSIYEDFCPYHYLIREGSATTSKVNEHKLSDPLKVLKIIRNESINDELLRESINARIVGRLIHLSTMEAEGQDDLIRPYKRNAQKELMKMIPMLLKGNYSKRIKVLSIWATICPITYSSVHKAYSKLKGTDKKYEIK